MEHKVPIYTRVAQERYRKSIKTVQFTVNPRSEPRLYEKLDGLEHRAQYLKQLIYDDMEIEERGR